jgi:pimeloyl-ACP methyl ester carboxylesterase
MWLVLASLATASEAPPPAPAPAVAELSYEQRWRQIDLRASRTGRTGTTLIGVGLGAALAGLLASSYGGDRQSEPLVTTGTVLVGVGAASAFAGLPIALTASMRSTRSMRARGVYVPTAAGIAGWTNFGLSLAILPAPVTLPASMFFAFLQMDVNRRFRQAAGLPPVRVQLTAEF